MFGERDWLIGVGGWGGEDGPKGAQRSTEIVTHCCAAAGVLCSGCVQGDIALCGGRCQWDPEPDLVGCTPSQWEAPPKAPSR